MGEEEMKGRGQEDTNETSVEDTSWGWRVGGGGEGGEVKSK